MPLTSPLELVELFHLAFLRVMEARFDRSKYVVKGGVNVRAWFGSVRYSEDIDIDAIAGEPHTLEAAVDKVVAGRDLAMLLAQAGASIVIAKKPKMTDTTQRWKFELAAARLSARTKIEFSRREDGSDAYTLEPVRAELARAYGMLAPSANHYTAASAVRQKIRALAQRKETQARDVWDLEHLLRQRGSDPRPLPSALRSLLPTAEARVYDVDYDAFAGQVLAYLAPADQDMFRAPAVWDRIREAVLLRLSELAA